MSRPVPGWIASYRAGKITLDELAERIVNHTFEPSPSSARSYRERAFDAYSDGAGDSSNIEEGTYDDVNLGDLTFDEQQVISKRVWRDVGRD